MREQTNIAKDGVEIDLQKLLLVYLRKWWLIILCGLIIGGASLYYTVYHITPMYRASVTVYVNNTKGGELVEYISGSNLSASKQLVNTYVNIITSDTVLAKVVEDSGLPYSVGRLRDMMSTEQVDDTEIFKVYITHEDPGVAAEVANAVAQAAPARIEEIVEGSSTKIIDYAKVPTGRYSPSYSRNAILGGVIGVVLAMLYITVRYLMDVRIKDAEDLEMLFAIPVLGRVPDFSSVDSRRKDYGYSNHASGGR